MTTRRGRPPHPDILTPRQWEVLERVREGLTNEQIGHQLGISRDGAKFHVSEIITKLGVRSRREAATWRRERETAPTVMLRLGRRARMHRANRRRPACRGWRPVEAAA
jgi:DNA-binding CsgD family transcriptional regulator